MVSRCEECFLDSSSGWWWVAINKAEITHSEECCCVLWLKRRKGLKIKAKRSERGRTTWSLNDYEKPERQKLIFFLRIFFAAAIFTSEESNMKSPARIVKCKIFRRAARERCENFLSAWWNIEKVFLAIASSRWGARMLARSSKHFGYLLDGGEFSLRTNPRNKFHESFGSGSFGRSLNEWKLRLRSR